MSKVKKVDCALLPPCGKTLRNKVKRAQYVSIIWGNADSAHPSQGLDPLEYGWKNDNGHYYPDWFPGPAEPDSLFSDKNETNEDNDDSGPEWSDDSDSESED